MNAERRGDRDIKNAAAEQRADAVAATQDALHVMTERFEAAIQASHVVVFNQDTQLRYTWILNPAFGYGATEVLGKSDSDLLERAGDAARTEGIKRRVIETGIGDRQEVQIAHHGAEYWYDLSVRRQHDVNGVIVGVTCAAVDITSRKQSEANVSFLAELTDALMPAGSPRDVARIAAERIGEYFGLSRCLLVTFGGTAQTATVLYEHRLGSESAVSSAYRISDFHDDDEIRRLAAGEPVAVNDVRSTPRTEAVVERCTSLGVSAILTAPYISDGRWTFSLSAIRATPHRWRADEILLLRELAARVSLRLERARGDETLRAAHDTFHHLVEQSPFGVYVVDADFRLVQVSAGAQKVFENVRPLLGRDFAEVLRLLWPEPFATEVIHIFQRTLETGVPYHAPSTVERRQDIGAVESYDWKTERLTLPDGRFGVVCHFYDLSQRQRYETALREADRQKDEFIAMLAHELRNPLAPIRTAAGLLRLRGPNDALVRKCSDTIDRQATQMARLLDDLLDVSRLSRGRLILQREPLLLDDVIEAAVETSRPLVDQQGQQLTITTHERGMLLDGDGARLTQVFANLLNNASKFSPAEGRIDVVVRREEMRAVVSIRDTGVGISAAMLDRVFDLFEQGDHTRSHGPAGLGIGLALARRLVELHGGTIAVASAGIDHGSRFTVTLPISSSTRPTERSETAKSFGPSFTPCKVLVVDDNVDAAQVTALLLEGIGCETRTAHDGYAALAEAEIFQPAIMLLDLGLPDLDGCEVARRIRALPCGGKLLLVAISGWGRDEDREQSKNAGFDHHLIKPVDPDILIQIVREATASG
jgi:PAS domain S-box-containing protein